MGIVCRVGIAVLLVAAAAPPAAAQTAELPILMVVEGPTRGAPGADAIRASLASLLGVPVHSPGAPDTDAAGVLISLVLHQDLSAHLLVRTGLSGEMLVAVPAPQVPDAEGRWLAEAARELLSSARERGHARIAARAGLLPWDDSSASGAAPVSAAVLLPWPRHLSQGPPPVSRQHESETGAGLSAPRPSSAR